MYRASVSCSHRIVSIDSNVQPLSALNQHQIVKHSRNARNIIVSKSDLVTYACDESVFIQFIQHQ